MRKVTIQAYAKINLYLDITGRLDGGYHALDTVMASVSCADFVTVGVRDDGDITVRMDGAACGEENTAYRAAKLVADRVGAGIDVNIVKRIPLLISSYFPILYRISITLPPICFFIHSLVSCPI